MFDALEDAGCVETDEDGLVEPTTAGRVASYYYLNYRTMLVFASELHEDMDVRDLLDVSPRLRTVPAGRACCSSGEAAGYLCQQMTEGAYKLSDV